MGYSDDSSMKKVSFFKESGKWYTDEAVKMIGRWGAGIMCEEFAYALVEHLKKTTTEGHDLRLMGMIAVCMKPYHEHSHPIMMRVDRAVELHAEYVKKYPNGPENI